MYITEILLLFTALVNATIGGMVYTTNSKRSQNRNFFFFILLLTAWCLCVVGVISSTTSSLAGLFIRLASYTAATVPVAFHLLCLSIDRPQDRLRDLLRRARFTLIASQCIGLLSFSSFYLRDVIMREAPQGLGLIPEPQYGPGFILYHVLYIPLVLGFILAPFIHRMRRASGMQRAEYQYILLGMAALAILGLTSALPALFGSSQAQAFGPLSVIPMNLIIAYGVATRRIMDVAYVLRRAAAYALLTVYLASLYALVWYLGDVLFHRLLEMPFPVAHLLAALAIAFSVAPAHGVLQRFANRLFVTRQIMDVGSTVGELNDMLQAIRTMPNLLERFSQTIAGSVGTESVSVFLRNHSGFELKYPPRTETTMGRIEEGDPLVAELEVSREPVVVDEISRLRPTPQLKAMRERLDALEAAVAVGIRSSEQLSGILLLGPKQSGRIYGAVELNALPILCDQLAVALENAELYTQTRDSKIYNEVLLDNLTSGVIAANMDGTITVVNREAQRITGLVPEELIDQRLDKLPKPLADALAETFRSGRGLRDQDAILMFDADRSVPIRLGSSVFTSHTGSLLGALVVFTDLTTIKKLETQVRRTDRLASIGTLAAGMAHEIKNPLVTVKTFTQLLPERYQDEDFRSTFSTLIVQEVHRIDAIVNQLLTFARPAKPNLAPIHLHDVVNHSLRLVEQQLRQKGITLQKNLTEHGDEMLGDANLLQQAFINFILNAIDSMTEGGQLTVSTGILGYDRRTHEEFGAFGGARRIRLTIRDTGVGIRPSDLPHIFDPFYTTKSHGTGLGLSVSHGIIQDHGGDIDVESMPGTGTAFHVAFPLHVREAVA